MTSQRQRPFGRRAPKIDELEIDAPVSTDPVCEGFYRAGRDAGYAEGFRDGAAAQPDRELWAFVEVPWSSIRTEDTIMGDDGAHYHVVRSGALPRSGASGVSGEPDAPAGWIVTLVCGTYRDVHTLDHDHRVRVLVPVALADALVACHAGLPGSRLIATRGDPGGGFDGDLPWRGVLASDRGG
jgi:hypothetical protein